MNVESVIVTNLHLRLDLLLGVEYIDAFLSHPNTLNAGFQHLQIIDDNDLTVLPSQIGQMTSLQLLNLCECECSE